MRILVTGATGFVGSAVVEELLGAGHEVLGLARSDAAAAALEAAGATALRGSLEDLDGLKAGAARSDGVVHLAFNHDFSRHEASCEDDRRAVDALAAGLAGSPRPLIVTSGTGMVGGAPGRLATEDMPCATSADVSRAASEEAAAAAAADGINVSIVRLPQVHDTRRQGLVTFAVAAAREKGLAGYVGDGRSRLPAAHVSDTARLYRLALERAQRGAIYHAVAEEGVTSRDIAGALGRRLGLPVASLSTAEADAHYGWLAPFLSRDIPASSAWTRQHLGWEPSGPGLIHDLERLSA